MDIYSYLNSRDIAEYCRKINKTWNPFEMAVIIGRSKRTIADKHSAWRELMTDYPDMPTPKNMHHKSYASLHEKLAEVIDYEERKVAVFKKSKQSTVYTYKVRRNGYNRYSDSDSVFFTLEDTIADAQEKWGREEAQKLNIVKMYIGEKNMIDCYCDYDGNIYEIGNYFTFNGLIEFIFLDNFYIDTPIPFKRGDILIARSNSLENDDIFVLKVTDHDYPERRARRLRYEVSDGTDLEAWGYVVNDNGLLYGEHIIFYDNFEYYRGELQGNQRLLKYISLFMQDSDELDLPALLTLQCRIMLENLLDDDLRLESLGLNLSLDIIEEEKARKAGKNVNE